MRTEREVLDQVLNFAAADARIRAVLLNGSRVNPAHPPDLLSDYDVLLSVSDPDSFARDESWMRRFGDVLLIQRPKNPPPQRAWLIVFADGVRIDFTLSPLDRLEQDARADTLTRLLLDKDGRCPALPPPDESSHFVRRPTQQEFAGVCNEFWWVLIYAAKGLWRAQLPYAKHSFDVIVRQEMMKLLTWYASSLHDWQLNPGAMGKHLPAALPAALWQEYASTFAGAQLEENWSALFRAASLVDTVGETLAERLGYRYDRDESRNAQALLRAIHALDASASTLPLDGDGTI